ncbi:MAG: peroxiredoxin [Gammaproteobacteria bacterium]|nr:peroxiredoxin [Gammaproteobacteria bacterium]
MLHPGQPAPAFELPDADMRMWDSAVLTGKNLVLFFYPKDNTTGCTLEAIEFTDLMEEFDAADTLVFGISRDDCVSHADFRDRHGLTVTLLADIDGGLCEAFGVWQEKERNGEKRFGIVRSSFIIDKQGVLRHALYDVKPKGHAAQILELVKAL